MSFSVRRGAYRSVSLTQQFAVKVPRLRNIAEGMRCNRWEREMWRVWRPRFGWTSLCPVLFADTLGFIVVMPNATETVTEEEAIAADEAEAVQTTAEGKPEDYRRLGDRIVAIDYGLATAAAVKERREYYRSRM